MKMEDESPTCAEMKPVSTRNTASVIGTTMSTARHLLIGENLKTLITSYFNKYYVLIICP